MISQNTREFVANVFDFLNDNTEYAVMRNFEALPDPSAARDIDIIIRPADLKRIRRPLGNLIDSLGWKIITLLDSDRLFTMVCARNNGHETLLTQWDFFADTSVWGIRLMTADEFLSHRIWNGRLWHLDVAEQFLDKYLYDRAVGAQYPEKYRATRNAAAELPAVREKLHDLFGVESVEE